MKNAKTFTRIVCLVLAALLLLSLIPVFARAADTQSIYFDNAENMSGTIYIYYWSDSNKNMIAWPGTAMNIVEGSIYTYEVPADATYVIFNNGSGTQTADLTIPTDGNMYVGGSGWTNYGNACAHEWGEGTVTTPASCTVSGVTTYSCSKCAATKTETISASHTLVDGVCSVCGYVKSADKTIYFANTAGWSKVNIYYWSDSNDEMTVWPGDAMTQDGELYVASIPGDAQYVIFNNGTTQTADLTIPADANWYADGVWSQYDPCDHTYTEQITTPATCVSDGEKTFTCSACGDSYTQEISALGHSYVDGACANCGAPENCDHIWDEGTVTQAATCWVAGTMTYTCTVCGETKTETLPSGHKFYEQVTLEPTCTATGQKKKLCYNCKYSLSSTLPKIDHDMVAGEVVAPTCTEDGYTVCTCTMCGKVENRYPVYHVGHVWNGNTCTTCGLVCDHSYVDGICSACHKGGPAYVEGYYEIGNAAQLYWFAAQVNSGNNAINGKLIADIDLAGGNWTSMGWYGSDTLTPKDRPYTGTFDGQGHTVSNFTVVGTDNEGLFGYCSSATIMNLGVINANVTGWRAGAVAGYALTSTVSNCFAKNCTITGYTTNSIALSSGTVYIAPVTGPQGGVLKNSYAVDCTLVDASDLNVYTAPVGGTDCQNGYYYNITYAPGSFSTVRNSTEVTAAQLASGEVTYLLNKGVVDGTQAWYQTCGVGLPAHSGKTVYAQENDGVTTYVNEITVCEHSYTATVTTTATCTTAGVKTYTCTNCGDSYIETIAALGHSYVDGTCGTCGEADPDYVAPVTQPTLTLDHPSLSFESEILYNVYFTATDIDDVVEMGLITFDSKLTDGTVADAVDVLPNAQASGTMYMAQTKGIAAKNMGDALYFKVYAKLSDGSYVYSDVAGYHAVAYANTILTNSQSAEMKALVVAMLNYGAEAQTFFGHNTDSLMNASLTAEQQVLVNAYDETMVDPTVAADTAKVGEFVLDRTGFTALSPTVSFEGAFSINYYFTTSMAPDNGMTMYYWTAADYEAADVLTVENATGTMAMTETDTANKFWGEVTGIAAKKLDETIYVTAVYTADGTTYCTGVIAYHIGRYCEGIAANASSDMQALAAATATYGYYAEAYLG